MLEIIKYNKYLISTTLLSILFMFPIMPNAVQSITLMTFVATSVFFYSKEFRIRIIQSKIWLKYILLTGFFWFSVLTFFWTEDKGFFFNELRPTLTIAVLPFIILFFHPILTEKSKLFSIFLFLIMLLVYLFLWFFHHIEGISIYQEIIAKEAPIRDLNFIDQFITLVNHPYKTWTGGLSLRGYELLGKNSFFTHSNYISTYFVFGFLLSAYSLSKPINKLHKFLAVTILFLSVIFVFYLQSALNVLILVVVVVPITIFYILRKNTYRIAALLIMVTFGVLNSSKVISHYNNLGQWRLFEEKDNNLDDKIILDYKRTLIYSCALQNLQENYLFGIGLGDVQEYLDNCLVKKNKENSNFDPSIEYNSHSQFLHFALVGGVLNVLLFFGVFIYLCYLSYMENNKLLFVFLVIVFTNCLFENYLSRIYGVLFFTLFTALLINGESDLNKPEALR